jgi:pyruvate formate lyase activating enzyme
MTIKLFVKDDCPRCPAAKKACEGIEGVEVYDVAQVDGLAEASFYNVLAPPPCSSSTRTATRSPRGGVRRPTGRPSSGSPVRRDVSTDADSVHLPAAPVAAPTPRLAGWVPTTMLDWPGRIATTLFLSGCNLRCPYCHNPRLVSPHAAVDGWAAIVSHIYSKRAWLDGVVVTGGEPTEDPDLPSLLSAIAEMGMPVKLDTNGTHPEVLRHLLSEGLVSYVAMDVKATWAGYGRATGRADVADAAAESVRLLIASRIDHEFRTTVYPDAVTLDELPAIASTLAGGRLFALQQYRPTETLDPRARLVAPYDRGQLKHAAALCNAWLPTIVRGTG